MPQYINDGDVSLFGRKRAKDLKIHHTVKCRIGPDLVAKYIWSFDSCYQWKQFFDASRQRLVKDSKKNPFPSLIAAEKLPLDAYEVAYSVNKQKRWNIMKIARKSITSFQNAERGLRVSVCNCITQSKVKYAFDAPELKSSILGYSDMITEFHGINGNYHNEYHLNNINKTISDIYRSRPRYPIKKKPRLYRRTFPKFKTLAIGKNGESLNKGMHPIHVMFLHHSFDRSVRSLNMRRKLPTIPAYEYACAYVSRRKHKKAIKKTRKHTASGRYHRKCRCYHKCGLTKETDQVKMITKNARKRLLLWELEDELYECEREIRVGSDIEIENEFDGFNDAENDGQICSYAEASEHKRCQPTLNDFIGIWGDKRKHKNCSRNKVRTVNRSSEYDIWLHSSPSTGTVTVEEYKEEYDINNNRKETIKHIPPPSIVINLDDDCPATNIETIASRLMPYAVELFGVIPRTFLSSIPDTSDELGSLLPQLNRNLPGFVCMNEILFDSGHTTLRFIINTSDKSSESEECSVSYSLRLSTSLTRFIPSDHFVSSNVYEPDAAECIACEQYSFNRPSKCNEVASTSGVIPSDSSYCAVCDSCSDDGFSLQCSHRFCRECWTSYASSMITSGIVPIKCPAFECDESLHTDHILLILPVSSHELYKRMLSNKCMLKPNWLQCSYCTNVLHVNELPIKQYLTNCECGNILCLKCKQTIHPALSCEDARRYFTAIQSNGQVNRFFNDDRNVMLKRCPFCGTFCERSDGCNHMTCVCGESFCYVCGEKWDGVVDHYECVVDVSVRVYLFDVSDADAGGISVNTLQECLDYRRRRSAQNLWDSTKKFVRVLNGDATAAHRAVSLYATVCEMLELNAVGIYRLRRRLRHVHDVRIGKHLQMLIGCLQHFKQRFDFYLKLLLLSQDNESTKPDRISRICHSIENLLTEYLSEVL